MPIDALPAVATGWGAAGIPLLRAFFTAFAIAGACYAAAVALLAWIPLRQRAFRSAIAIIIALSALLAAGAWRFPALLSADVYAYAWYGELAAAGADPYHPPALEHPVTELDRAVALHWGAHPPPCAYGPAFVFVARMVVEAAAPFGAAAVITALRLLALGGFAAVCALLVACTAGRAAHERAATLALVALNPALIWGAVEGHNDALMVAAALGGLLLAQRGRLIGAGIVMAGASLIKAPGALVALAALPLFRRPRFAAAFASAVVVAAAVYLALAGDPSAFAQSGFFRGEFSAQGAGELLADLYVRGPQAHAVGSALGHLPGLALLAYGISRVVRRHSDAWVVCAVAAWTLLPNPYPWYAIWVVPIGVTALRSLWTGALVGISLGATLHYVPDVAGDAVVVWVIPQAQLACVAVCTLLWLAIGAAGKHTLTGARQALPEESS